MPVALHSGGRSRRWIARRFGDPEAGDRWGRRLFHLAGALVLLVYVLPPRLFRVATVSQVLVIVLVAVLALEAARWAGWLEFPMLRPWEVGRPASFAFFAVGLVVAVELLPEAIAIGVVLGGAWVDPLIGELRRRSSSPPVTIVLPALVYAALVGTSLRWVGQWSPAASLAGGLLAGAVGVAVERPNFRWLDDDVLTVLVPGGLLVALALFLPGATGA